VSLGFLYLGFLFFSLILFFFLAWVSSSRPLSFTPTKECVVFGIVSLLCSLVLCLPGLSDLIPPRTRTPPFFALSFCILCHNYPGRAVPFSSRRRFFYTFLQCTFFATLRTSSLLAWIRNRSSISTPPRFLAFAFFLPCPSADAWGYFTLFFFPQFFQLYLRFSFAFRPLFPAVL